MGERLVERSVRSTHLFVAAPEEHGHPVLVDLAGDLRDEGGLALAGLPGKEDDLTPLPSGNPLGGGGKRGELVLAPDDPHGGTVGQAGRKRHPSRPGCVGSQRLPADLERLDGLGQALQLELAERGEGVGASAPGVGPHHVGNEDLTAFGSCAQAGGLDDRFAEVVLVLLGRFTGAQCHPQPEGPFCGGVVPVDGLLHGHRTDQSRRGHREDDHEAVAQVLDLGAPARWRWPAGEPRSVCGAHRRMPRGSMRQTARSTRRGR